MVKNGPLYFWSKSKAIALQKWSKMEPLYFGQKVRVKKTTLFKAIALQKWSTMDHYICGQK